MIEAALVYIVLITFKTTQYRCFNGVW